MKNLYTLLFSAFTLCGFAQTGPAGVANTDGSSTLALWLDANTLSLSNGASIADWYDLSGYGNHAEKSILNGGPTFISNALNGYPTTKFTASSSQYLRVSDATSLNPNTATIFVVGKMNSASDDDAPFIRKSTKDVTDGYGIQRKSNQNKIKAYVTDNNTDVDENLTMGTFSLMSLHYDKSKLFLDLDGATVDQTNETANISNSSDYLFLGASQVSKTFIIWPYTGPENFFDGEIAEVIIFNEEINNTQRILVSNYLAAKYGLSLTNYDVYNEDNSTNGNFDHDVAGIGRVNAFDKHESSQGSGIIKVSNASNMGNKKFMMWGHDGGDLNMNNTTDIPFDLSGRLNRTWRVSEVKYHNLNSTNVGAVDLQVDLNSVNGVTEDNLRLLVDSDGDGDLADETPIGGATEISTGIFVFSQTTALTNNKRFSFGIKEAITWDGTTFDLGSGTNNQPGNNDNGKDFLVYGTGGVITHSGSVNNVTITSSGEITIQSGVTVTVNGDIDNQGTIIIEDGASLIQTATSDNNTGTGTYTIKRTGNNSSNVYNIWSSPIQSASQTTVFNDANACDIWTFDGQSQSWLYDYVGGSNINCQGTNVTVPNTWTITGGDNQMDPAKGYFVPGATTATRSFHGKVNNGTITTPIYTTSLGNNPNWDEDDWNLVGNPYPSAISAADFWTENAINNNRILDAVYFWDEGDTTSGYHQNNDYATWNLLGGIASNNTSVVPTGEIASGQGFWVYAAANTNLVFKNSMRSTNNSQFFKTKPEETKRAWVAIESPSGFENNILIGFNSQTTDQIDNGFDAHKNVGNANIKLASMIGNEEFAIQGIKAINWNTEKEIPLAIFSTDSGGHTISELNRANLDSTYTVYLKDKMNGNTYNLTVGSAQVHLSANINYTQRFVIILKRAPQKNSNQGANNHPDLVAFGNNTSKADSNVVISNIEDITQVYLNYKRNGDQIYITNEDLSIGTAKVYNVNGQLIESIQIGSESTQSLKSWATLSNGLYLLQLTSANGHKVTHKVVK